MKKLSLLRAVITSALLIVLVMSFGACTVKQVETPSVSPSVAASAATVAPSAAPSATEAPSPTVLPVLSMATNATFAPYESWEGDKIVGIDADVATAIADKLGMTLKIDDMDFTAITAAVSSGKDDIGMAAMTILPERLAEVSFSDIYATGKQVVIVKEDSKIATPADLKGKTVGVQLGTTGDIYCSDDKDKTMQRFNKGADAIQALLQGKVDAVVIDNAPAKVFVEQNTGLKILPSDYRLEDYAIEVAKENTTLLGNINTALSELKTSGDLQKIIDKYIIAN
jgi:arginine/lysine/histidine transporter system substrate-binding protein